MGGRGSGGARVGSGRKSKTLAEKALHGTASLKEQRAAAGTPVVDEFDAPDDLKRDERLVWLELAPYAFKARTLTRATSYSFRLLCRNIVLERALADDVEQRGGANHRGIIQRVDAELTRFCLSPLGKALIEDKPKVEDPFSEFDGSVN